ncbi:MAG: CDP-alcohol phosphatidyltransferase family protein [Myxococcales bacterium]|nr:CDP-alcohol phosphatidyltransferase family protein [Myxococcales bacterium]
MKLIDPIPLRAVPANLITCTGMTLGFLSIASSFLGNVDRAAWFIALCALIDKMDGTVARRLNATSEFGIQMDSFSDLITFGLAPAALVWSAAPVIAPEVWGHSATLAGLPAALPLASVCILYCVFAALRLAKFNVTTSEHPRVFHGLPTTLAGSLVALLFLATREQGLLTPTVMALFPPLLAVNAGLMVSNLPLPKLRRAGHPIGFAIQILLGVAIFLLVPLQMFFWLPLAVLVGYVGIGFIIGLQGEAAAS